MTVFDLKHLTLDKNNAYVTRTMLLHDVSEKSTKEYKYYENSKIR